MAYEKYWSSFLEKELTFYDTENRKYLKKGYLHFDNRIWFPDFQEKFKKFITKPENVVSHSFFPFLKVVIEIKKRKGYNPRKHKRQVQIKPRPICYAAHFDALIYSFYSTYLSEKYEEFVEKHKLNESVLAYRSLELCNIDFAKKVFDYISNKGECVAVSLDIKGFFDTLNHDKLKENWLKVINTNEREPFAKLPKDQFKLFNSLSKFAYVEKTNLLKSLGLKDKDVQSQKLTRFCDIKEFRNKIKGAIPSPLSVNLNKGIPQGSPISAVLSNIYMINYDKAIIALKEKYNFIYRRYCDDIIIVCEIKDLPILKGQLYKEIENLNLEIQPNKEDVVYFLNDVIHNLRGYSDLGKAKFKNLQYLGFEFNGQNTYIRSSSLSRFHRRMKDSVREAVKRAYGKKARGNRLLRKRLHERFTHLGGQNFLTYAYRASEIMDNSETIKKQVARHFDHLNNTIDQKTRKHLKYLKKKGKIVSRKN